MTLVVTTFCEIGLSFEGSISGTVVVEVATATPTVVFTGKSLIY